MQKLRYKLNFGSWIEFALQLDKFLKIKPDSGFLCKYEKIKIMTLLCNKFDCMIGTMNSIFVIDFQI